MINKDLYSFENVNKMLLFFLYLQSFFSPCIHNSIGCCYVVAIIFVLCGECGFWKVVYWPRSLWYSGNINVLSARFSTTFIRPFRFVQQAAHETTAHAYKVNSFSDYNGSTYPDTPLVLSPHDTRLKWYNITAPSTKQLSNAIYQNMRRLPSHIY